jgi:hypothetical protein
MDWPPIDCGGPDGTGGSGALPIGVDGRSDGGRELVGLGECESAPMLL